MDRKVGGKSLGVDLKVGESFRGGPDSGGKL